MARVGKILSWKNVLCGMTILCGTAGLSRANTLYFDIDGPLGLGQHGNPDFVANSILPAVTPDSDALGFDYHYAATLDDNSVLKAGDFFTVYDFGSFMSVVSVPTNWTYSVQTVGFNPANQTPADGPLENITFTYHGGNVVDPGPSAGPPPAPGVITDLGQFVIESADGTPTGTVVYAGQSETLSPPGPSDNTDITFGPSDSGSGNPAPMPASVWGGMSMLAILGAGKLVRRRSLLA